MASSCCCRGRCLSIRVSVPPLPWPLSASSRYCWCAGCRPLPLRPLRLVGLSYKSFPVAANYISVSDVFPYLSVEVSDILCVTYLSCHEAESCTVMPVSVFTLHPFSRLFSLPVLCLCSVRFSLYCTSCTVSNDNAYYYRFYSS